MTNTMIPSMYIAHSQITDKRIQILYILQTFTSIPDNVSSTFRNDTISMQTIAAGHNDATIVCSKVREALQKVYMKLMPDDVLSIEVEPSFIDEARYDVSIDVIVTTASGETIDVSGVIKITDDNQVTFEQNTGV